MDSDTSFISVDETAMPDQPADAALRLHLNS